MTTEIGIVPTSPSPTRKRKLVARGLLVAAMAGGLAFAMAMPAAAAAGDTTTTFTLGAGTLSVAVQATAQIGGAEKSGATSISGSLGAVTVTDERGGILGWVVNAASGNFTHTTETITTTSTNVTYDTGGVAPTTGTVTVEGTTSAVKIDTPAGEAPDIAGEAVVTATAVTGNNTVTYSPTIAVTLPSTSLAGLYSGTVSTSVA